MLLGPARLNGLRFFNPTLKHERIISGPFRRMKNPMYTGYFFVLLGVALLKDSLYDIAIAAESLVLLNGVQAWIENRGLTSISEVFRAGVPTGGTAPVVGADSPGV